LEYALKEAVDLGADMLITCGGIQSNHCRATAAMGAKLGIKVHLILAGDSPEFQGNFLLDELFGASYQLITPEAYGSQLNLVIKKVYEKLYSDGYKPYVIPTGASNGIGTFGYYRCMKEIVKQEEKMGIQFDSIVTPLGSGGTLGGLFLYSKLNGLRKNIYGINIAADEAYFRQRISEIIKESMEYLSINHKLSCDDLNIIDGYVGDGYALSRSYEIDFIKKIAALEGIVLDPVYTGKAFYGLVEEIKNRRFNKNENILFIHTGGLMGLFPKAKLFK